MRPSVKNFARSRMCNISSSVIAFGISKEWKSNVLFEISQKTFPRAVLVLFIYDRCRFLIKFGYYLWCNSELYTISGLLKKLFSYQTIEVSTSAYAIQKFCHLQLFSIRHQPIRRIKDILSSKEMSLLTHEKGS